MQDTLFPGNLTAFPKSFSLRRQQRHFLKVRLNFISIVGHIFNGQNGNFFGLALLIFVNLNSWYFINFLPYLLAFWKWKQKTSKKCSIQFVNNKNYVDITVFFFSITDKYFWKQFKLSSPIYLHSKKAQRIFLKILLYSIEIVGFILLDFTLDFWPSSTAAYFQKVKSCCVLEKKLSHVVS